MEKQVSQRRKVVLADRMMLPGGGMIDCRIRDLSNSGAGLKVASIVGMPDVFSLHVDAIESVHTCETVWRKQTELGVRFTQEHNLPRRPASSTLPCPHASTIVGLVLGSDPRPGRLRSRSGSRTVDLTSAFERDFTRKPDVNHNQLS